MNKLPLNFMDVGWWPLNYCSKLVKGANDVMYSIAVDDRLSAEARLNIVEQTISDLRKSIVKTAGE